MPKVYCTLPTGLENLRQIVNAALDKLGLEAVFCSQDGFPSSQQICIENTTFMIADVTVTKEIVPFRTIYEIGYARRAQKAIVLISHAQTIAKLNLAQEDVLYYDPQDLEPFRQKFIAVIASLCAKEKIRYNKFPNMPAIKEGSKLPVMPSSDLRVQNYVALGDIFVESGRFEEAQQEYTRAILYIGQKELQPHHASIFFKRAYVYKRVGMVEESLADYTQTLKLDSKYLDALIARGLTLYDLKRYEEALNDFKEAAKLKPDFTRAYIHAGSMFRMMRKYDDAIQHLNKAIELNPDFAEAYFTRGQVYGDTKKTKQAIEDFTKAIAIKPQYPEAYLKRGQIYADMKDFNSAIKDFTDAIKIDPNNVEAYNYRGQVLFEKGFHEYHEMAIKDWQKAIELGSPESVLLQQKIQNITRAK